jgi:hypothetical protein
LSIDRPLINRLKTLDVSWLDVETIMTSLKVYLAISGQLTVASAMRPVGQPRETNNGKLQFMTAPGKQTRLIYLLCMGFHAASPSPAFELNIQLIQPFDNKKSSCR